jgi:small-conductance mechanosensitive channel
MHAIGIGKKFLIVTYLLLILLVGTALASFAQSMPESGKIIFLGIGLLALSFWAKRWLKQQEGSIQK